MDLTSNRLPPVPGILAVLAIIGAGASTGLEAQTHTACRVPDVGAIYIIGTPGTPPDCLDPSHVQFSWSGTSDIPDTSITSAKLTREPPRWSDP